jgi:hypothetical protein
MSQLNLSFSAETEELIPLTWPALVGLAGVQVVVVRRVLSTAGPPSITAVVAASVAAVGCCAAIALDVVNTFMPTLQDEPGFFYAGYLWSVFAATMWPVLAGFVIAELLLVVYADSRSPRLVTIVSLASALTASWMMAWWLYVGFHSPAVVGVFLQAFWMIGIVASAFGFVLWTTTWLIARRIALTSARA